jgi:MSHA biogenesis protein MshQ
MTILRFGLFVLAAMFTAAGAHAQIAFRGAASAGVAAPTGGITFVNAGGADVQNGCGTANPGIPGGLAGDLLIAVVEAGDAPTITMAGWNTLFLVNPNGNHTAAVFWRIRTGGDPNAVVQAGGCDVLIAQVAAFRGVDATLPFYTAPLGGGNLVSQNSGAVDTGTQATGDANAMLVYTTHVTDNRNVANAGGFAEAFDSTTGTGNDAGISLAYRIEAAPGNKGPFNNMDLSGGGNDWNTGALFALRPAPLGLTIARPPGTVAGDVMVAAIVVRPSSVIFTPPAGWSAQAAALQNAAGNSSRQQIFYRVAGGAEPATYTWLFDSAHTGAAGGIVSYSGVDTAAPFDAFAGNLTPQGGDSNLQHRALAVTTTVVDTMVISTHSLTSAATWTSPAGMTERVDVASQAPQNAVGISVSMHEVAQAAAGSTGDKVATAASNGDTGSATLMALRPLVPQPVLHWSLDQLAWNGTPGEVLDLSANGLHGTALLGANTAFGTPALAGSPGTCRYGVFDGVDDYAEVADNPLLDITDELTVMMWLRPTAYPTGGNLKSFVSKDQNYEAHLTSTGVINWWWGGGALQLNSAAAVPLNQWTHVALVYSRAGTFQRIYLNGVQDANTNNQAGALVPNNMPFQIASDQGFAGRQFPGWIDEVYVFANALSQSRVQQYMNATRPCASAIDHFAFSHSGSGVGCVDQQITITAHDTTHTAVDANALAVNLGTSHGKGTWTGILAGGGTLNDVTAGDGAATYTFAFGSNSVTLLFLNTNLTGTSETFSFNVSGGGYSEATGVANLSDDPPFTMYEAGFRFRNIEDANETVPVQISGKASNTGFNARTIRLQAINTNTATGSCTNLFANQAQTVELGAECNNPAACAARQVSINGANVATSNSNGGAGALAYTPQLLNFNASSEADTVIYYPDAGEVSLHAQFDLNPLVAGNEMAGSSNAFVVRPFGLAFPGVQHGTTAAAAILAAAGDNFALTLRAYQWAPGEDANIDGFPDFDPADTTNITDNGDTPNFAWDTAVGVAANLPGIANGVIDRASGGNSFTAGEFAGGTATANNWRYSEAGNAELLALSANYIAPGITVLGLSGFDGTGRAAGHIGRFKPKSFALTGGGTLTHRSALPGCAPASTFTYLGEELTLVGFTLEARNAQSALTQNYTGAYAKLDLTTAAALGLGARDGVTNLTARIDSALAPSGSFINGVANLTVRTAVARATPDNPDGPFAAAQFGIAPNDADPNLAGGVQMGSFNLDVDGAGGNDHAAVGPTAELRYGRLLIGNAYGPVQLPLPMPIQVQYWNGGAFAVNGLDSCTNLAATDIGLSAYTGALAAGESVVAEATIAFAAGIGTLTMTGPGAGNAGSVLLTPDLAAAGRTYLQGRWSGAAWNDNPSARAAFGVYGQPRNFIFFRENY